MKRGFLKNKSLAASNSSGSSARSSSSAAPASGAPPTRPSSRPNAPPTRVPIPPSLVQEAQDKVSPAKIEMLPRDANGAYVNPQPANGVDYNSHDAGTASELLKIAGIDPSMLQGGAADAINIRNVRIVTIPAQRPFLAAVSPRVANMIENSPRLCARYTTPDPARYRIDESRVHGKGVFATEAIERGGLVLREPPMVVTSQMMTNAPGGETMIQQGEIFAEMVYQALPEEDKEEYMSFVNCKPAKTHGVKRGIMDTNSSGIASGGVFKGPYGAVTRDISRLNHSCEPNAYTDWDVDTMTFGLYAERPIKKGEEIFIAYVEPSHPKQHRQYALWGMYSFNCRCTKCSRE
ncbi:SET domain-containing protein [Schizophyllum commune H4-8]|uniref:SET domain-containing protein n=1 Tax=Schizophyllum commune (strain H4-8 / FGSC 9210) TaxID=578458 RepID=D8PKD8_SCHCM|nr:SET domain-containing protein [Schizophyllum commune H4-8]KAI5894115.1 SET domain-containing protein [Schizophyllum commune H4-8]